MTMKQAKELQQTGITFVQFTEIAKFKKACESLGIVYSGGAFSEDGKGQYFYN